LTAEQVDALTLALEQAEADAREAEELRQRARTATTTMNRSLDGLGRVGRAVVNTIKGAIALAPGDNDAAWAAARLNPPSKRGPARRPNAPTSLSVELRSGGVEIAWKGRQPRGVSGVVYLVERSLDGGRSELVGTTGAKRYTDTAVPAGGREAVYSVCAVRGVHRSEALIAAPVVMARVPKLVGKEAA
jgi:hypothetical protein